MKYVGNAEPHYGLRKLSIGVASVLLGMTATGIVGHADTDVSVNNSKNVSVDESVSDSNLNGSNQVVLQGKQIGGDNPANIQNIEGEGTENTEGNSVSSDNQHASNTPQNMYVQSAVENKDISSNASNINMSVSVNTDPGYGMRKATVDLSFDVSADQFQKNSINLGKLTTDSKSVKGYKMSVSLDGATYHPVIQDGVNYGNLYWQIIDENPTDDSHQTGQILVFLPNKDLTDIIGTKHLSIHMPYELNINYDTNPKAFNADGKLDTNMVFITSNKTIQLAHFSLSAIPKYPLEYVHDASQDINDHAVMAFNSTLDRGDKNEFATFNNTEEFNQWIKSGFDVSTLHLRPVLKNAMRLSGNQTFNLESYSWSGIVRVWDFDENGNQTTEAHELPMSCFGQIQTKAVADGLSLKDLEALNFNGIVVSRQADGSFLIYTQIDTKKLLDSFNYNNIRSYLSDSSYIISTYSKDSNKALDNTINAIQHGLFQFDNAVYVQPADTTEPLNLTIQMVDLDTGKMSDPMTSVSTPDKLMSQGQSAVKMHIISAVNGIEMQKVQSFVDWPNQGKHVQLSIPTITGYHLETNAPQNVLAKFGLKGTALTTNSAVDYPAEDTISDYYFVMTPNDETATVNIIDADEGNKALSTGTITGKFGQVVSLSSDLQSKLDALMATGHYVESANDLDGEVTYGDGASKVYTIKLKHKLDSVQRHYRVIEDLPDGSQKVIVDVSAILYKDSDVNYYGERGAYVNGDGTKALLKSNNVSISTGYVVPGDPSGDNLQSELIDNVPGYSWSFVDQTHGFDHGVQARLNTTSQLALLDVFNGTTGLAYNDFKQGAAAIDPLASQDFHIKYIKNQYPVIVTYYDLAGEQISTSTRSYDYLTQLDLTANTPVNYVLLAGQNTKLTVGYDHNEIDLLVAPKITQRQEQKIIRRIIAITDPKGLEHDVEQDVVFVRNVYHDNAANSDTEGSWRVLGRDHFVAYMPAVVDDYTAQSVRDQVALPTDQDQIVKLSYTPFVTPSVPKYIDAKGIGYNVLPTDYEVVSGQNSESGSLLIIKKPASVVTNKVEYVTRTITIEMPNGHKRTIIQKARKGSKFVQAHLPKLRGYQVQIDGNIDSADANGNLTATVKFVKI